MGYLRFFAIIADLETTTSLHGIPETIPWRAYRMQRAGLVLIDWLKRPNPNNVPRKGVTFPKKPEFGQRPSGVSFESSFGQNAPGLDAVYAEFQGQNRASAIPLVAAHTTLLLSRLTSCPALGVASDDDDWDFACEARAGWMTRVRFSSEGDDICIDENGQAQKVRIRSAERQLHNIALAESGRWSDELSALFGFDGSSDKLGLVEIDRCRSNSN